MNKSPVDQLCERVLSRPGLDRGPGSVAMWQRTSSTPGYPPSDAWEDRVSTPLDSPPAWEDTWRDRLAFVMIVLSLGTGLLLVTMGDGNAATDGCVASTTAQAASFAAVLGDTRPLPEGFAEQSCARRPS